MSRRDARRHIFNLMFQNEFNKEINTHESIETYRNEYENFERKDILFIKNEYTGILDNVEKIDSIIDKFSIGWSVDRLSTVDKAILRIAVYDIMFDDDIPNKVFHSGFFSHLKKPGLKDPDCPESHPSFPSHRP